MKYLFYSILLSVATLAAQSLNSEQPSLFNDMDRENPKYSTSMEQYYKTRSSLRTIAPQILEQELEAEDYLVGPGDQFRLFIYGELENSMDFTVLPEGGVYIPTVGKINLKNLTLQQAKEKISERVKELYIKADISVNLVSLRKFRTYLIGEVEQPGTYFVQGSNRISDIMEIAGGVKDWADLTRIALAHVDGSVDTLNLMRFYRYGDKQQNPFVTGGDMVFVQPIDLTRPHVMVESKIEKVLENKNQQNPATLEEKSSRKIYHLLPGETVLSFLNRISAFSAEIDLTKITLIRGGQQQTLDLLNHIQRYDGFKLQSKDLLIIPSLLSEVYVQGEVQNPGAYIYNVNLTAQDYAGKAGILEVAKSANAFYVVRQEDGSMVKGGDTIIRKGDTIIVPRKFREDMRDYMTILIPIITLGLTMYNILSLR